MPFDQKELFPALQRTAVLIGSTIVDDKGERIGAWYSREPTTAVEILGEKKIGISPPVIKDDIRSPLLRD